MAKLLPGWLPLSLHHKILKRNPGTSLSRSGWENTLVLSSIPPGKVPEALIFLFAKSRQMAILHQISGENYLTEYSHFREPCCLLTILRKRKDCWKFHQGNSWKLKKKSPHFEEESYEIPKILGGFGQSFGFLRLKLAYLASYSF